MPLECSDKNSLEKWSDSNWKSEKKPTQIALLPICNIISTSWSWFLENSPNKHNILSFVTRQCSRERKKKTPNNFLLLKYLNTLTCVKILNMPAVASVSGFKWNIYHGLLFLSSHWYVSSKALNNEHEVFQASESRQSHCFTPHYTWLWCIFLWKPCRSL